VQYHRQDNFSDGVHLTSIVITLGIFRSSKFYTRIITVKYTTDVSFRSLYLLCNSLSLMRINLLIFVTGTPFLFFARLVLNF
jgi:hypothetical protein